MLLLESGFVLIILTLIFLFRQGDSSPFRLVERGLARIAKRSYLSVLVAGIAATGLRALFLPITPIPSPGVPDEFSYLLMADTFSHGRLTNPTHPLWVHFEGINVIHQPTYCSMYYPAQGFFLAVGQVIGKHPFWGVWLSAGLMCGAICWMLQAWVPPYWALLGSLLAAIRIAAFSYWTNSYFGGCVAALGGALVLGALPRIKQNRRTRDAVVMGVGFTIIVNSRPFETLFFGIPILVSLAIWMYRRDPKTLKQVALPLSLVFLATVGFMFYYFWRTTGNPLLPPYLVSVRRYSIEPSFPWLPLRPTPRYNHTILRNYYLDYNLMMYQLAHAHPFASSFIKLLMLWFFFLGPLLSLPFLALGFALPYGMSLKDVPLKTRFLLIVCGATLLAVLLPVYANPHYAALATAGIYALLMITMQRIRRWRLNGRPAGVLLIRATFTAALMLLLVRAAIPIFHLPLVNSNRPETWCSPWYQLLPRVAVERQLQALPGQHVVVVRFSPEHSASDNYAWVNNSANIDQDRIVWANDMGTQNDELIRYFAGRHFWLLEPDQNPIRLSPYNLQRTSGN
jgi:hypothetical protein